MASIFVRDIPVTSYACDYQQLSSTLSLEFVHRVGLPTTCTSFPITFIVSGYSAFTTQLSMEISPYSPRGVDLVLGSDIIQHCSRPAVQGIPAALLQTAQNIAPYSAYQVPPLFPSNYRFASSDSSSSESALVNRENETGLAENRHAFDPVVVDTTPSTSHVPSSLAIQGRSLLKCCFDVHNGQGVRGSPFTDDPHSLLHTAIMHSINTAGLHSTKDVSKALIHHLLSGQCFLDSGEACKLIRSGYSERNSLISSTYDVLLSCRKLNTDHLLLVCEAMGIDKTFNAKRLRLQIQRAIRKLIPAASVNEKAPVAEKGLLPRNLERLPLSVLFGIAESHGLSLSRFSSSSENVRIAITEHILHGRCHVNVHLNASENGQLLRCVEINSKIQYQGPDISENAQLLFRIQVLENIKETFSLKHLKLAFDILNIPHRDTETLPTLRRKLAAFIEASKNHGGPPHRSARINEEQLQQLRMLWPETVPQTVKDELITHFKQLTSSHHLTSTACASCSLQV
ncbi:hypothetical protein VKT23_013071 [Stygiomarasmius scandens]|uniref:F-box domain-containing protein n=1 Tax=Marasmiellus scandens TaxID=2682957 RepID=A0ABR1J532_9AGAR